VDEENQHGRKENDSESKNRGNNCEQPMSTVERTKSDGESDEAQLKCDKPDCAL